MSWQGMKPHSDIAKDQSYEHLFSLWTGDVYTFLCVF
jgi:hypothetical protein